MRRLAGVLGVLAVLLLAACGSTTVVREPDVDVPDAPRPAAPDARRPVAEGGGVRIAVVTHGQASSSFWAIVRNGVDAAEKQMDVVVNYRAPDVYSLRRMEELIDEAVASRPDGLVVSFPEPGLLRRARESSATSPGLSRDVPGSAGTAPGAATSFVTAGAPIVVSAGGAGAVALSSSA